MQSAKADNPYGLSRSRDMERSRQGTYQLKVVSAWLTFGHSEERKMNETDLAASVERLMARVDYYLHCELDEEYDHEKPEVARRLLEAAIRQELIRASAVGVVSTIAGSRHPSLQDNTAAG